MTEQTIEEDLIAKLCDLKYEYRDDIRDRSALEQNFRKHFEELNRVRLTDSEFARLLELIVTPDVFAAARTLREINSFERDDGTPLNYTLVNIKDWCKNTFEVVNQLRMNTANSHHRYDVMLLMNGIPMVQIELKNLHINPRRAMQQIVDYKTDPGNGYTRTLLCFLQLFIGSNRSETWYFANNNERHFRFNAQEQFLPLYQFAAEDNRKITLLHAFAEAFLAKCTLSQMISRYMVLVASEQKLMVMRPYQVYAVQRIVDCIHQNSGNGYIWHTTGSGKTLTSFKASTLLKDNPDIEKCLFVVDRKDLDRQTREEFNKFQAGCVEENTNTDALVRKLVSDNKADKVIVTTIQKLGLALDNKNQNYRERLEPLSKKRVAFIFDECHRSQFGENHKAIKAFFPKAQLFGFTGTPIFQENARFIQVQGQQAFYQTTADIFQQELHAYTITHAIEDKNVLKFHIDYFKPEGKNAPKPGEGIAKAKVVERILEKHDTSTAGRKFNAILATSSINDAIEYHALFQTLQAEKQKADPDFVPLNVACVFSPPAYGNLDVQQIQEDLPQEKADNSVEPEQKKAALEAIIAAYNTRFGTSHKVSEFDLYYQDVQKRIKDHQWPNADLPASQKIDVVIVVDMLLTGFDSKYLNTLYVDKNLKFHGLIQAFSRTNRVLNDTKPYGNILDFRQQQDSVDAAIELFSGANKTRAKDIWLVDEAPVVIANLTKEVKRLEAYLFSQGLDFAPEQVANLKGDAAKVQFIERFKEVQRLKTQLDQYTDLTDENKATIAAVIPADTLQAFRGVYLSLAQQLKPKQDKPEKTPEDEATAQLDFEFVLFASAVIDYDYIMGLIARMSQLPADKRTLSPSELIGLIEADAKFMEDREVITAYIRQLEQGTPLSEQEIKHGYEQFKAEHHDKALVAIAEAHGLAFAPLKAFVETILRRMIFDGEQLTELLTPLELGWKARTKKELALVEDLSPLLNTLARGREISGLSAYEE
jgi:type I restriction enzyme R subunit